MVAPTGASVRPRDAALAAFSSKCRASGAAKAAACRRNNHRRGHKSAAWQAGVETLVCNLRDRYISRYQDESGGEHTMGDTSVTKVQGASAPRGKDGRVYLASGVGMSMRLWRDEQPGEKLPPHRRPYETIGYVIAGRAELHIEGQMVFLEPGDSYVVPKGSEHNYKVLEPFTAVEATHPPAELHGREDGQS
jgi:quercetin dioxygenase-like cupin family protein